MNLTHRPTTLHDLDACLPLIRNGFAFGPHDRPALPALWRHLLAGGMAESAVVEDRDRTAGGQVVGFGLSLFVTDGFVREARTALPPCLAPQVLSRWREGRPPFLNAAQVRRANSAEGLNCLILHNGWEEGRSEEETRAVRHKIIEAFFASHCGYRLQCFLHEVYGGTERDKMLAHGWRQERDHAGHDASLLGLRREDVLESVFHPFYGLFHCSPPRLFFCPAEQALLRRALQGESDAEAAEGLDIALSTIHKRWRAIFGRVCDADPDLLPAHTEAGRGAEKRTRLLHYLQHHPEELRPVTAPPRAGRG